MSAGSVEETIAFYFAIGCRQAQEINQELYEEDEMNTYFKIIK